MANRSKKKALHIEQILLHYDYDTRPKQSGTIISIENEEKTTFTYKYSDN